MSKKQVAIALVWGGLLMSSASQAGWQSDCQTIESQGPSPGACKAIESTVSGLQPYAPFKTFIDTSTDGSGLDGKFPWGSPQWASQGSGGGGGSAILGPDQGAGSTQGGGSSSGSGSSSTFN